MTYVMLCLGCGPSDEKERRRMKNEKMLVEFERRALRKIVGAKCDGDR